jgi:hypothetical protein
MHPYTDQCIAALSHQNALVEPLQIHTILDSHTALDVCGLSVSDHGRNCCCHRCCGNYVAISDGLVLRIDSQFINGNVSNCIQVYKVDRSTSLATCHVGYIAEYYFQAIDRSYFNHIYLYVDYDYRACQYNANCG